MFMARPAVGLLAVIVIACTAPSGSGSTASPSRSPTTSPTPAQTVTATPTGSPASQQDSATAVRFADTMHGWVGAAGGILGTSNGGARWERQLSATQIEWVRVLDMSHAWARSIDGTVYRTTDGKGWERMPPATPPVIDVYFVGPLVGWATAAVRGPFGAPQAPPPSPQPSMLLGTVDGGRTWRTLGTQVIDSVCFANERDGWGAEGERILRTSDGGSTWTVVFDGGRPSLGPWHPRLACGDAMRSARVQLTGSNAALGHAPYLVYRTTDSGVSWQLEFAETYTLGSVVPPGTPTLGSFPSLIGSLGSGRTWFVTCTPPVDDQSYVILDGAGATLARGNVRTNGCAVDAQVIDERHVVAVSLKSVIATDDGGVTWKTIYTGPVRAP